MAAGIAGRLEQALTAWAARRGRTPDKKEFQQAMAERLGRGSGAGVSYPAVLGYLSGKATPSIEWLNAAADLLGVRAAWLAFNDGPMREEEGEGLQALVFGFLEEGCPEIRQTSEFVRTPLWRAYMEHFLLEFGNAKARGEDVEGADSEDRKERHRRVALQVGSSLRAPLAFSWSGAPMPRDLDNYFLTAAQTLIALAAAQRPRSGSAAPQQAGIKQQPLFDEGGEPLYPVDEP